MEELIKASPEYVMLSGLYFKAAAGLIAVFLALIAFFLGKFYIKVEEIAETVNGVLLREASHLSENKAFVKSLDDYCTRIDKTLETHQKTIDNHTIAIAILQNSKE